MKKSLLMVAAIAALALAALPAVASAYSVDTPENSEFTVSGEETKLTTPEQTVTCASVEGEGEYTSSTTGTVQLLFKGCKAASTNCTSSGQSGGNIETTPLTFHIGTAYETNPTTPSGPAIVITPHEGHFATFSCVFGLVEIEVRGKEGAEGIVGTITAPGVGEASNTSTLTFETDENNEQVHMDADIGNGIETFTLVAYVNGTPEPAGQDGTGTTSFVNEGEGTLTE